MNIRRSGNLMPQMRSLDGINRRLRDGTGKPDASRQSSSMHGMPGRWRRILRLFALVLLAPPAFGLEMPDRPPGLTYAAEDAFAGLVFHKPVAVAAPPGETQRLFIVEKWGRIRWIDLESPTTIHTFLDISERVVHDDTGSDIGLLGMAFHPDYARNRRFFVFYYLENYAGPQGTGNHFRIARFQTSPDDPNSALPDSEVPLITQLDEHPWHAGGDMHFGRDGYLYVSLGDEGGEYNSFQNAQRIDKDFFSGILRLDVDQLPENLPPNPHPAVNGNYSIPGDNPFVEARFFNGLPLDPGSVRTEFYAVGLRSPWRFSIDPASGDIYCNDVGQVLAEEIDVILRGANYGWAHREGDFTHNNGRPPGLASLLIETPPVAVYGRDQGISLSAGLVVNHSALPALNEKFLFSDFYSKKIGFIDLLDPSVVANLRDIQDEIAATLGVLTTSTPALEADQVEWEASRPSFWEPLETIEMHSANGTTLTPMEDHSVLASGTNPPQEVYELAMTTELSSILGIRLDALPDNSLPNRGPGRAYTGSSGGNFALSEFEVHQMTEDGTAPRPVPIESVVGSFEQLAYASLPVNNTIDGDPESAWAIFPEMGQPHFAVFRFATPLESATPIRLKITLRHQRANYHNLGRFKLSVTTNPAALHNIAFTSRVAEILAIPPAERSDREARHLAQFYRSIAPALAPERDHLEELRHQLTEALGQHRQTVQWILAEPSISAMGINPATSEILMLDYESGKIRKLIRQVDPSRPFPATLADTGAFTDLESLTPEVGIVPYQINAPFWSDHAIKSRWFHLPESSDRITFHAEEPWRFPAGAIWIKHFELEMQRGNPNSRRRLETRFLVKTESGAYGVTYRWNEAQDNAFLVSPDGMDETFQIWDNGRFHPQTWHYPSQGECMQCHTDQSHAALGFNTPQLNRLVDSPAGPVNNLDRLDEKGFFDGPLPPPDSLAAFADIEDWDAPVLTRVRSYLTANCVQCHHPDAATRAGWDARFYIPLDEAHLIGTPAWDTLGIPDARVIDPGSLDSSVLYQRLASFGPKHMPPLATSVLNQKAVDLLAYWITKELPELESNRNIPPAVQINQPADNSHALAPVGFTLKWTASDSDGSVATSEVWINDELTTRVEAPPYETKINFTEAGHYSIRVVAADNLGAATSASIQFQVDSPTAPPSSIDAFRVLNEDLLQLKLIPTVGATLRLESSRDLVHWQPATNVTAIGHYRLIPNPTTPTDPHVFYQLQIDSAAP